jgi:hypothetical protein
MMNLTTGTHQSGPTPQGLPNNIMQPTRSRREFHQQRPKRAGEDGVRSIETSPIPLHEVALQELQMNNSFDLP